jgi:hypothetical protein
LHSYQNIKNIEITADFIKMAINLRSTHVFCLHYYRDVGGVTTGAIFDTGNQIIWKSAYSRQTQATFTFDSITQGNTTTIFPSPKVIRSTGI